MKTNDGMTTAENDDSGNDSPVSSQSQPGLRWLYVLAIGLGFFTTGISWSLYDSYLPADFLPAFIVGDLQNTIIGAIMVMDNILALLLQPYIGAKSDSTRSRWGKRMPYIMIGTPIAAVFFTLIAYGWALSLFWLMFAMITIFNVSMAFYRAPVVALMPDLVASEHRSQANGVINLMGGIGAIYAFAVASQIYKIEDANLAAVLGVAPNQVGPILAFLSTSIIMVIAVVILFIVIKEPEVPYEPDQERVAIVDAIRQISFSEDRSAMTMLGAILFWFLAYNAISTWFTKYGNEILGFATADASFLLNGIALSFVIFAVPAGYIANYFGRKRTILSGLAVMAVAIVALWFTVDYYTIMAILAVAGIGWALINVNSIVMMWQMLGQEKIGAGTGLYYLASMSAAVFGPLVAGIIFDLTSIGNLYPLALVFLTVAFIFTALVKTGEVHDEAIVERAYE